MAFETYNARILFGSSTGDVNKVVVRMDSMTIEPVPYVGSGSTVVELFDGRYKFLPPTWGYRVVLNWTNASQDHPDIRDAIDYLISAAASGNPINLFVEQTNSGTPATFDSNKKIDNVLPVLTNSTLQAVFDKRFRRRPVTLELRSAESDDATPHDWLSDY